MLTHSHPAPARRAAGLLVLLLVCGALAAIRAQDDPLRGTWSGQWIVDGAYRTASVTFTRDGDTLSGEMMNPAPIAFDTIEFDDATLRLVAEGNSPEHGHVRVEARVEEVTRLNGTLTHDDASGDLRLTKWTYRPR